MDQLGVGAGGFENIGKREYTLLKSAILFDVDCGISLIIAELFRLWGGRVVVMESWTSSSVQSVD